MVSPLVFFILFFSSMLSLLQKEHDLMSFLAWSMTRRLGTGESVSRQEQDSEREAVRQRLWEEDLSSNFFDNFGEPQSVEMRNGRISLTYDGFGTKEVGITEMCESGHWEITPTDRQREEKDRIQAEFQFDGLPNVGAIWRTVAFLGDESSNAKLTEDFDRLPSKDQSDIIEKVRLSVRSPESLAEAKIKRAIEDVYHKRRIDEALQDIISLQAPGEISIGSREKKGQEEVMGSYGGDSWGTGRRRDVIRTVWFLKVGGREIDGFLPSEKSIGGVSFFVDEAECKGRTAQQVCDRLLESRRETLLVYLEQVRVARTIPNDSRIYDLSPEEWTERYVKSLESLQAEVRQNWQKEESEKLQQLRLEREIYETAVVHLKKAREDVSVAEQRAKINRVNLDELSRPNWGKIGYESSEEMDEHADEMERYSLAIGELVTKRLRERGETEVAAVKSKEAVQVESREIVEGPASPAPCFFMASARIGLRLTDASQVRASVCELPGNLCTCPAAGRWSVWLFGA
ncbi:MAG: hypothetical protein AUJ19_02995 [Parcubacteria group bacterium CG1_02_58_44]|nr:MAG: hypothetical protein AUJ19_02995 [Parcubacteria group bacterium CG1_02_58_44]